MSQPTDSDLSSGAVLRYTGSRTKRCEAPVLKFERLLVVALLCSPGAALAKPPTELPDNLLDDRFTLQAAFIASSNTTRVRLDSSTGLAGTEFDAEKDAGLPARKSIARGELVFRIHERGRVRLANFFVPLDRRGSAVLTQAINFGDETYNAGDAVQTELQLRVLAVAYTYSIVRTERFEVGASLGFDVIGYDAQLTVPARLRTSQDDRSAPAPLAGLDVTGRLSSRFYAEARAQYLRVHVASVAGTLQAYEANVLYRAHPNITLGLGYTALDISVDAHKVGDSGSFSLKSTGPQLFARVGF
jgi:hypothetical protein